MPTTWPYSTPVPVERICETGDSPSCWGTCDNATRTCVCSRPGSKDQVALSRINNCAATELAEPIALSISIFIGAVVASILIFVLRRKTNRPQRNARKVVLFVLAQTVLLSTSSAIHLAYGYGSPVFFFFLFLASLCIGFSFSTILHTLFVVVFASAMTKFPHAVVLTVLSLQIALIAGPFLGMFVASLTFADDPGSFNSAMAICFGCIPIHLLVTTPVFFSALNQLIARTRDVLRGSQNSNGSNNNNSSGVDGSGHRKPSVLFGFRQDSFGKTAKRRSAEASSMQAPGAMAVSRSDPPTNPERGNVAASSAPLPLVREPSTTLLEANEKAMARIRRRSSAGLELKYEQMRRMLRRLVRFRAVTVLLWAPLEIAACLALAFLTNNRLPWIDYTFFAGIIAMQLLGLTFAGVVVSAPRLSINFNKRLRRGSLTGNYYSRGSKQDDTALNLVISPPGNATNSPSPPPGALTSYARGPDL